MNILITSVGRRTYMVKYFMEALDGCGEVHVSNSYFTYPLQIAHKYVITPHISEDNYIGFLLAYCLDNHIHAIISLFDYDLLVLSKNKSRFDELGIRLIISDYTTIKICNDKWALFNYCQANGLPVVQSYITPEACLKAINQGILNYPLIMKPRWGSGSIGVFQVDHEDELKVLHQKVCRIISETHIRHESNTQFPDGIIIQEKVEGVEYGLDVFNDFHGNYLSCVAKRKLSLRSGETEAAEVIEDETLSSLGKELSMLFKHKGNMDVDIFFKDGRYCILEINCRFGGQYPFAHLAGANYPKAIINMLLGVPVPPELLCITPGIIGFKDLDPVVMHMSRQ